LNEDFGLLVSEKLETLMLVENDLGDDFVDKVLLKQLKRLENLETIDLSHNYFESTYQSLMMTLYRFCPVITNIGLTHLKYYQKSSFLDFSLPRPIDSDGFLYLQRLDLSSSFKGDDQVS